MKQQRKCNDLTLRANDWKVGKKKKKKNDTGKKLKAEQNQKICVF